MLPLIGSLISAGAGLLGGAMNAGAQRDANNANIAATEAANQKNYEAQKEFAQNGLRWKASDAHAAGIHPVYAMGAQPMNFSPSFVGSTSQPASMGDGIVSAGQDIGRAVGSTLTQPERAYNQTLQMLQLDRAGLENELLRSQIRRTNGVGVSGPGFPMADPSGGNFMFHGVPWDGNPSTTNAQKVEDRYGDLVSSLYGLGVVGSDVLYNVPSGSGANAGPTVKSYERWSAEERLKRSLSPDTLRDIMYWMGPPPADPYAGIFR